MFHRISVIAVLILVAFAGGNINAASADPDKDAALPKLLDEARVLITKKQPQAAIERCDKVIAFFTAHYAKGTHKVYCARNQAENLGYLLKAASEMDKGNFEAGKKDAIVLSPTWARAHFMKGFALQDLGRVPEAKAELKLALELSPWNSQYLSELGSIYKLEKNWTEAKKSFEAAEEQAALSPDETKAAELGVARRGLGYVLVELGQLDEAEKKYLQCLEDDPGDKKAAAELE